METRFLILKQCILLLICMGQCDVTTTVRSDNEHWNVRKPDYEAIHEKLSDLRKTILNGLESIKDYAKADNPSIGRTIAEMIKKGVTSINTIYDILEEKIKAQSLTKQEARAQLRKVEMEMGQIKSKVIQEIQKLNSNTIMKIVQEAIDCYQKGLQFMNEIYDLLES